MDSPEYGEKFQNPEWYRLGWVLMEKWKGRPIYDGYKRTISEIKRLEVELAKFQAEVRNGTKG